MKLKKNIDRYDAAAEDLLAIIAEKDSRMGGRGRQLYCWMQAQYDGQSFVEGYAPSRQKKSV